MFFFGSRTRHHPLLALLAGTVLLVLFYLVVSLLQHIGSGRLQRRLMLEYGLLGGALMAAIIYVTFTL